VTPKVTTIGDVITFFIERKEMKITSIFATVLMAAGAAYGSQEAVNNQTPDDAVPECKKQEECKDAAKCCDSDLFSASRFKLVEGFEFVDYNGSDNDLVGFTQTLVYRYSDSTNLHLDIPFFSNGNTGFGMTEVGFDHTFIRNPCKFVDSVSLGIDFLLPTGENAFGGDDVSIGFGFDVDGNTGFDRIGWQANFNWIANQDTVFEPVLGGLTGEDVVNAGAGITYELCKAMSLGFDYEYWQAGDDNTLSSIGPGLNWNVASNIDFNCELNFMVDNGGANNTDFYASMGLGIKF